MPSEVRTLVFDQGEVVQALSSYRKRKGKPLSPGSIFKYVMQPKPRVRIALAIAIHGEDRLEHVEFASEEIGAALVMHCIDNKIPLPGRDAQKALHAVGDSVSLVISMGTQPEPLALQATDN